MATRATLAGSVELTPEEVTAIADLQAAIAVNVPVPKAVTPLQARKALRAAGLLDAVNTWLTSQAAEVQEVWEYALTIERNNPMILAAAEAMGLTSADLDALFIAAAQM